MPFFKKLLVPLPPLFEQKKIAEILSTWDVAIEQTRKLIDAKKRRKKALMQQLLTGKKRLPGFGVPALEEDQVPEDWQEMKLNQAVERVQRTTTLDITDVLSITATVGFVQQKDKFSRIIAGQNLEKYILLEKGEFAYNKGNSKTYPQGCVYMIEDFDKAAVPNVYFCFRPRKNGIYGNFFKFYFENGLLNHQLQRVINTGVRNDGLLNLNPTNFFNIKIKVPPISEQRCITDVLASATNEINQLGKKLKALEKQKRGLMQKLLTGEVRVK
jgi:type I restriction enzyme S subunit